MVKHTKEPVLVTTLHTNITVRPQICNLFSCFVTFRFVVVDGGDVVVISVSLLLLLLLVVALLLFCVCWFGVTRDKNARDEYGFFLLSQRTKLRFSNHSNNEHWTGQMHAEHEWYIPRSSTNTHTHTLP